MPDWIGERGDVTQAAGHGGNSLLVEREAIEEGGVAAFLSCGLKVLGIGFDDLAGIGFELGGYGFQRRVLLRGGGARKLTRRLAGEAAHIEHHRFNGVYSIVYIHFSDAAVIQPKAR